MSFQLHDRYQAACQYCFKILEGDSATEAILKAEDHEHNDCLKNKERLLIAKQIALAPFSPPSFCISSSDAREIVRITPDGQVIVNPDFTTEEAAKAFWEAVMKFAAEHQARGQQ